MSGQKRSDPTPGERRYVAWRGELVARLALTRAGLAVQDAPPPQPFDLLASTADAFYFLVEVKAYSSMHASRPPAPDSRRPFQWPVDASILRAVGEVNLPVVLFVVDADREVGHYARLDRLPRAAREQRTPFVLLTPERDLSPDALAALVSELRHDWAASRRPA